MSVVDHNQPFLIIFGQLPNFINTIKEHELFNFSVVHINEIPGSSFAIFLSNGIFHQHNRLLPKCSMNDLTLLFGTFSSGSSD